MTTTAAAAASSSSPTAQVPSSLLLSFFQDATIALNSFQQVQIGDSLVDIRKSLLQLQLDALNRVVATANNNDHTNHNNNASPNNVTAAMVQQELQTLGTTTANTDASATVDESVMTAMKDLNQAARLAFCRVVLRLECLYHNTNSSSSYSGQQQQQRQLKTSGKMQRDEILEFFGLCNGAVQLDNVKEHLRSGNPFFSDLPLVLSPSIFPQKRLEQLQRLMLQAVGYHADHGTQEIKRIFFDPNIHNNNNQNNEFTNDNELAQQFGKLVVNMNAALNTASLEASHAQHFSDQEQGGVTRVVSVEHSELDADGTTINTADPPNLQHQQQRVLMARQAAALQQDILQELLGMEESARAIKLQQAKEASEDFMKRAQGVPPGPERVAFLRAMDPATQRLLATHKLWNHRMMMMMANHANAPNSTNSNSGGAATSTTTTSK